jgi:hypothetical protein
LLLEAGEAMDKNEVEDAEEKLTEAREVLSDPAAADWPDHSFQVQDLKAKEDRLEEVKVEVTRAKLEAAVKAQAENVDLGVQKLEAALKPLTGNDGAVYTKSQIDDLDDARSNVVDRLKEGVELEKQSRTYQEFAKGVADRLKDLSPVFETANRAVAFNEGPIAASKRARELIEEARGEEELTDKIEKMTEAKAELDRCTNGASEVAKAPALAKVRFDDGGKRETPKSLAQSCQKRSKSLKTQIAQLQKKAKKSAKAKPKPKKKKRS